MTPQQRIVSRQLRDNYGITKVHFGRGGKHEFAKFVNPINGQRCRLTIGSNVDLTALVNWTRQELRARLGPPMETPTAEGKRKMEDMMPEPFNPIPLKVEQTPIACSVALYGNKGKYKHRLRFTLPVLLGIDRWSGVNVSISEEDTWELWDDISCRRRWINGDKNGTLKVDITNDEIVGSGDPFGNSPATLVEIDGHLFVTCPIATRVPVALPRVKKLPKLAAAAAPAVIPTPAPVVDLQVRHQALRADMLDILRIITKIETVTEWRLKRESHGWQWNPPEQKPIRLED